MQFLLQITLLVSIVFGKLEPVQIQDLKDAPNVIFKHDFPRSPGGTFKIDEKGIVRINITNESSLKKTVFGVTGYYTHAGDASKDLVKISTDSIQKVIKSGKTIPIKFKFSPQREAAKVGLLIVVDYYDSDEPAYRSIGVIDTIELVNSDSILDFQRYALMIKRKYFHLYPFSCSCWQRGLL
jgi:hypothetical protein